MNIEQIATAVTTVLVPFTPFLIEAGKEGGKKLAEVIAEKGGEAAWEKAQRTWAAIKDRFGDDKEVKNITELVAEKPENARYQDNLKQLLIERMQEDADFTNNLLAALGGEQAVQQIIARNSSVIEDVSQDMEGTGEQTVLADDNSHISGVTQSIKRNK